MTMIYKEIKVMSLNVNGLGNPVKRAKVMSKVKKDKLTHQYAPKRGSNSHIKFNQF